MNWAVVGWCILIAVARICDISLDTVRTVAIVQGRRIFAAILGFFEALIYILVIAKVLLNISSTPIYALFYAIGFAAGTWLGIFIEHRLAFGEQLITIFTRKGLEMVTMLRTDGYRVTELNGAGRDGPVTVLYIEVPRRLTKWVLRKSRNLDPTCFYVVNDVRLASAVRAPEP